VPVGDPVVEEVPVRVLVAELEGVGERDGVGVNVLEGVTPTVNEEVGVAVGDELRLLVEERVGVPLGVEVVEGVSLGVEGGEALPLKVGEGEGVTDGVREAEGVTVVEVVRETELLAVCVPEGVRRDEGDRVLDGVGGCTQESSLAKPGRAYCSCPSKLM
jgi:hypothetical protein